MRWMCLLLLLVSTAALSDWKATDARVAELARAGQWKEALQAAQQLVEDARTEFGPDSAEMATSLNTLGVMFLKTGDRKTANQHLVESLHIREKRGDQGMAALSLYNLGNLAEAAKDWPQAQAWLERCLALRESTLGPFHDLTRATLRHLERVSRMQHQDDKAREYEERLMGGPPTAEPIKDPEEALEAYHKAREQEEAGRYDDASANYERALQFAAGQRKLGDEAVADIGRMALQLDLTRLRRQLRLPPDPSAIDGLLTQTLEGYARMATLEPQNPSWLYLQAVIYAAAGDGATAQPLLDKAATLKAPARMLARIKNLHVPKGTPSRLHDRAWLKTLASNSEDFTAGQSNPSTAPGIPDWERRAREAEALGDSAAASRFRAGFASKDDMERYW